MFSIDCGGCPRADKGCPGCLVSFLTSDDAGITELSRDGCGYVVDPGISEAIEVLRAAGLIGALRILDSVTAA